MNTKPIKIVSFFLFLLTSLSMSLNAASGWETDFEKAQERAKAEGKPMLLDFTGSDWCGWCIKLDEEVFSKSDFKRYADDNLILVELDFPAKKKQSKRVAEQNRNLQERFGVRGYPTIILLDSEGQEIARTGYKKGGAKKYVEHLESLLEKKKS